MIIPTTVEPKTDRISVATLLDRLGHRCQGTVLWILAVLCLVPIPGLPTLLGMAIATIAVQMIKRRLALPLLDHIGVFELSSGASSRTLALVGSLRETVTPFVKRRLVFLTGFASRPAIAVGVLLMALLIVLPIPFGNYPAAVALILIGLAMERRDGVALLLALGVAAIAVAMNAAVLVAAWQWVVPWIGQRVPVFWQ